MAKQPFTRLASTIVWATSALFLLFTLDGYWAFTAIPSILLATWDLMEAAKDADVLINKRRR